MKKWLIGLVIAIYMGIGAAAWAAPRVPAAPAGSFYVQDYAGVLSGDIKNKINKLGAKIASQTKAQVVVVTIKSLNGEPIQDYALTLLRQWKIGDKSLNNGVLLLVAVDDKKSRIEVGYGLEGALNDAKVGRIQDEYMLSYFQRGDYDQGIWNSYKAIMRTVSVEYGLKAPTDNTTAIKQTGAGAQTWWNTLPWWLQFVAAAGFLLLFMIDWLFFGGSFTFLLLSLLRFRGGGGGGYGGGYGGGSSGGGGADRKW